jgi:peptidoglycan biosynthesis protein MviN/MurJ (putative lipid II flippase)
VGLLVAGFLPVFLSELSRWESARETEQFREYADQGLRLGLLYSVGFSLAAFVCADFLVRLALFRTPVDPGGIALLRNVCRILFAGAIPYVAMLLLVRIHIARMNWFALWVSALANLGLNTALNWIFYRPLGVSGIALATSVDYALVAALLYGIFVRQRNKACGIEPAYASSKPA